MMKTIIKQKILIIFGTRPEALKLAPVIAELSLYKKNTDIIICVTAQHREMLDQMLDLFQILPNYDLNIMTKNQTLTRLSVSIFEALDPILEKEKPDWIIIQGDTTTVMIAALSAFYRKIKIAHIEAGLRTYQKFSPFPEEINRRITTLVADLHFAPTNWAKKALIAEKIPNKNILVSGNTIIDTLRWMQKKNSENPPKITKEIQKVLSNRKCILVTCHRREHFDGGLHQICQGLIDIVEQNPTFNIIYPVHLNPLVKNEVYKKLGTKKNIYLMEPVDYSVFVYLMTKSYLILTDSGGVQEEATTLGIPILIMRDTTERQETVISGNAMLVGVNRETIVKKTSQLIKNTELYKKMARKRNIYGDGNAAKLIVKKLISA